MGVEWVEDGAWEVHGAVAFTEMGLDLILITMAVMALVLAVNRKTL